MKLAKQVYCSHNLLENDIHEFIFHESSRAAIDEMVAHIYTVMEITPKEQAPLYLIDNSQVAAVPLNYLGQRIKEVNRKRESDRKPGRIAILYDGVIGDIANILLRGSMRNKFRFFTPQNKDKAMIWLRDN